MILHLGRTKRQWLASRSRKCGVVLTANSNSKELSCCPSLHSTTSRYSIWIRSLLFTLLHQEISSTSAVCFVYSRNGFGLNKSSAATFYSVHCYIVGCSRRFPRFLQHGPRLRSRRKSHPNWIGQPIEMLGLNLTHIDWAPALSSCCK